jgi:hypothetical protein
MVFRQLCAKTRASACNNLLQYHARNRKTLQYKHNLNGEECQAFFTKMARVYNVSSSKIYCSTALDCR